MRPRWSSVSFCTRRRTLSRHRLPTRTTWNGSATRVAWSSPGDSPARNDSARSVATTVIAFEPRRVGVGCPSPQVSGGVALDHVDDDLGLEVDQAGGVDGRMGAVGGQERGLVDPELGHLADAVGVVDQRRAVLDHGVHHRPPAHPELGRHRRHRAGVGTDLAARLGPRPPCQHGLGVDVVGVLGPRLGLAVGLDAAPPALVPHQPSRAPEAGQIADVDRHPVLRLGPHAAAPAAHLRGHRLDGDDQFGRAFGDRQHPESVKSQKRLRQADTVVRHQGSPIAVALEKPQRWRGPWPQWWMPCYFTLPTSTRRAPFSAAVPLNNASAI